MLEVVAGERRDLDAVDFLLVIGGVFLERVAEGFLRDEAALRGVAITFLPRLTLNGQYVFQVADGY